jgi:hypothetical protein
MSGRLYHSYNRQPVAFPTLEQLLFTLERFYNWLNFPFPSTNDRVFCQQAKPQEHGMGGKIVKDEELLEKRGDLGSFIIRVQHRQNSSWQGRITCVEQDKTVNFRSMWGMIKLMDNAMGASKSALTWDDTGES